MKNKILILAAVLFSFNASAQKDVILTIKHMLGTTPFAFNQATSNNLNNNLEFTRVDYYISKITIIHDNGQQTPVPNKYVYVRGAYNLFENLGNFNVTNVEGIKFHVGVDSPNNNADPTQWTGNHPLAPKSPSMHWGWASGYRFAAIEGNGGPNLDKTFQFHSLFNANYFEQTVMVNGLANGNDVYVNLEADYNLALRDIDVSAGVINHGDNTNDLKVLENFRDYVFTAGTAIPTSVSTLASGNSVSVYPNPSKADVRIVATGNRTNFTNALVMDLTGRIVNQVSFPASQQCDLHFDQPGFYVVKLMNDGNVIATKEVVIH